MAERSQPMRMMDIGQQVNIGRIGMMQLRLPPKVKEHWTEMVNNEPQMGDYGIANDLELVQDSFCREGLTPTHLEESSTDQHRPKRNIDIDIIDLAIIFENSVMRSGGTKGDTEMISTGRTESSKKVELRDIAMQINTVRTAPRGYCRPPRAGTAKKSFSGTQLTTYGIERRGDASRRSQGRPPKRGHRPGLAQSGPERASATVNDCSLDAMNNLHILELGMNPTAVEKTLAGDMRSRINSIITVSTCINVINLQKKVGMGLHALVLS